jgi:hypothetical protein
MLEIMSVTSDRPINSFETDFNTLTCFDFINENTIIAGDDKGAFSLLQNIKE